MHSFESILRSGRTRLVLVLSATGLLLWLGLLLFKPKLTTPIDSYATCATAGYPVSETSPPTCSDGHHTYRGGDTAKSTPADALESVPFEILVDGDSGGKYPQTHEIITSGTGWERYWAKIHSGLTTLPPILPVDFSQSDVIALSEGQQPTTGYNLKITSITTSNSGSDIYVTYHHLYRVRDPYQPLFPGFDL
jgi:hypothetical protein